MCLDGQTDGRTEREKERKLCVHSLKALSVPYRYEYISLYFDTMYKLVTASLSFCLQCNSVLSHFFQGTSLFVSSVAVMSVCSVRYNVLLGMDSFFRLNYCYISIYSEISLISLFFNYV